MITLPPTQNITDSTGKILLFGQKDYINDVCNGDHCFMCGKTFSEAEFNEEHVIPDWILRKYNMHDLKPLLPNDTRFTSYSKYKFYCCIECNTFLGKNIEEPVSELVNAGEAAIKNYIQTNGPELFLKWLSLIFFKLHLKDRYLYLHRDIRQGTQKISDDFAWDNIYLVHVISRMVWINGVIFPDSLGSFYVFNLKDDPAVKFDYFKESYNHVFTIRFGNIGFVASLTDAGFTKQRLRDLESRLVKPLSHIQLLEFYQRCVIERRRLNGEEAIYADKSDDIIELHKKPEFPSYVIEEDYPKERFGANFYITCGKYLESMRAPIEFRERVRRGELSFLLNEKGDMIDSPID